MPLSPDVLAEIEIRVRGGFDDHDSIVETVCEEMYEPGELDCDEVDEAVAKAFAQVREESKTWPRVTDCDRLDAVFAALNERGIIALQNAGYTQSDGYEDVVCELEQRGRPADARGYCFYQGQDLERAVQGDGLYLAFGPIDPAKEDSEGPAVGAIVVEELRRQGFESVWNGTFAQRILVPRVDWKRR